MNAEKREKNGESKKEKNTPSSSTIQQRQIIHSVNKKSCSILVQKFNRNHLKIDNHKAKFGYVVENAFPSHLPHKIPFSIKTIFSKFSQLCPDISFSTNSKKKKKKKSTASEIEWQKEELRRKMWRWRSTKTNVVNKL